MLKYHLYIDDSGSRYTNKKQPERRDGMDYFALGGILVAEQDIPAIFASHKAFSERWALEGPLHSTKIRGSRGIFSWLAADKKKAGEFYADLDSLILSSPILSISCVIHRPGYVARYEDKYPEPWWLCQTAFAILVERSAKFVGAHGGKLELYFEESGKAEDRALVDYMRSLKKDGMPFAGSADAGYTNLPPDQFRNIVLGEPRRVTKKVPMIQFADLVLYAMARGGYDRDYRPYRELLQKRRIIDALLKSEDIPTLGVKYSCFDTKKAR